MKFRIWEKKEGRYADSRQDSGHSNFSYRRYAEKRFPRIYRDLYGDATLVPMKMGTNMAAGNLQKTSVTEFLYKIVNLSRRTQKRNNNTLL